MQETTLDRLSTRELAAWRGFLRVHSGIVRELNTELELTHALPLAHYEVLFHLDGAPCGKLTMSELAQSVLLSQSGVTRLVDRLVRSGLVVREGCSEDRRVMYARLTDEGRAALCEARPTLIEGVRQRFLAHFADAELDVLADAWERLRPGATA